MANSTSPFIRDNKSGLYLLARPASSTEIIKKSQILLRARVRKGAHLTSPLAAREFIRSQLAGHPTEIFAGLFLDAQHRVIGFEKLFFGTIDSAAIYPREILRAVLDKNACAVIFAHNHPSGNIEPSEADKKITLKLKQALSMIDVRTLDHFVISDSGIFSFAEAGLL